MPPTQPARLINALPDAVTAAFFASVWIAPRWLGDQAVANGMLMMLVEFVLVHASAMIGATAYNPNLSRGRKALVVIGSGAFYALFVAAFALSFSAWWPLLAFGWLLLGKLVVVFNRVRPSEATVQDVRRDWGISAVAYLVGVFVTVLLPLPRLGITKDVVAMLGLPGSGLWVEKPHTVIAFGLLYFGFLAWAKWRGYGLAAMTGAPAGAASSATDARG